VSYILSTDLKEVCFLDRYPKQYIVKSMLMYTNTSTIYQTLWKS
jgi:hypothetical protein